MKIIQDHREETKSKLNLMKTIIALLSFSFLSLVTVNAQIPDWTWAKSSDGDFDASAEGYSVTTDAAGNVYVAGSFYSSTIIFGNITLYNTDVTGYTGDIFLVKYNTSGSVLWAKKYGGTFDDVATSIAADAFGSVYVTGGFYSPTIAFGTTVLTNADASGETSDIFLAKFNSGGNILWAKVSKGDFDDYANFVAADTFGNAYVTGYFDSPIISFGSISISNADSYNIFLAKYDTYGNVLWIKNTGGSSDNQSVSVVTEPSGNVYIAGFFSSDSIRFGTTTLVNIDTTGKTYDIFLAKYDVLGNELWAKSVGDTSDDFANSVSIDASGNIYLAGAFQSPVISFDSNTLTNTDANGKTSDFFLAKYDTLGNVLWVKSEGGNDIETIYSVFADPFGNIYAAGWYASPSIVFDTTTIVNAGFINLFIVKYDTTGNIIWVKGAGGNFLDYANSVTTDISGNVYMTGSYSSGIISFDSTTFINTGLDNVFLAKLGNECLIQPGIITATTDTICNGTPGSLMVTGNFGAVQWQSSVTPVNFTTISGATATSYSPVVSQNTYFRVVVTNGVCTDTSTAFQLTVTPSPVAAFSSLTMGKQVNFESDSSIGASVYNWDFGDSTTDTGPNPVHTYTTDGNYHVCLTVFNGSNCSFTICHNIDVITTGINTVSPESSFIIYPNPVADEFFIDRGKLNVDIKSIRIYDLMGREVINQNIVSRQKNPLRIDVSPLAGGVYLLKIITDNAENIPSTFRIIKLK